MEDKRISYEGKIILVSPITPPHLLWDGFGKLPTYYYNLTTSQTCGVVSIHRHINVGANLQLSPGAQKNINIESCHVAKTYALQEQDNRKFNVEVQTIVTIRTSTWNGEFKSVIQPIMCCIVLKNWAEKTFVIAKFFTLWTQVFDFRCLWTMATTKQ